MKINSILFITYMYNAIPIGELITIQVLDNYIDNELYLGFREYFNTTRKDCVWRNEVKDHKLCTKEVKIWLYSNGSEELIDTTNKNWLKTSIGWSENKENVIFVHGYASGDQSPPLLFMRDVFVEYGQYNFFMIDYGPVGRAPCYVPLVQNTNYVSKCLASYLRSFVNNGMRRKSITCIGHSMGAHICGLLKRYLGFRPSKIIALDSALPLIPDSKRLTHRDANIVQALQTNAGYYGDIGIVGHASVCVNNGNIQPFCTNSENPELCSHMYALCFTAQSLLDYKRKLYAKRCSQVCPHLDVFQIGKKFPGFDSIPNENLIDNEIPDKILIGMNMPRSARGSYCLSTLQRPFCKTKKNPIGDKRCCSLREMLNI